MATCDPGEAFPGDSCSNEATHEVNFELKGRSLTVYCCASHAARFRIRGANAVITPLN